MEMLLGTGIYLSPQSQIRIPKSILGSNSECSRVMEKASPPGTKDTTPSGIKQANEETYQSLFARLEEAINRMVPPSEGTEILLKQLAWENANTLCQDLIRPIRKTGAIQDYIKACIDASPAIVQGMDYAAAMKGEKILSLCEQNLWRGRTEAFLGMHLLQLWKTRTHEEELPGEKLT